jgi:hypothetical protein
MLLLGFGSEYACASGTCYPVRGYVLGKIYTNRNEGRWESPPLLPERTIARTANKDQDLAVLIVALRRAMLMRERLTSRPKRASD